MARSRGAIITSVMERRQKRRRSTSLLVPPCPSVLTRALEVARRGGMLNIESRVLAHAHNCVIAYVSFVNGMSPRHEALAARCPLNTQTTALLLVAWGFVVVNETLGSGDADGIRFPVLPARDISGQAMVQLGRVFLVTYPDYIMSREYNAFFA